MKVPYLSSFQEIDYQNYGYVNIMINPFLKALLDVFYNSKVLLPEKDIEN